MANDRTLYLAHSREMDLRRDATLDPDSSAGRFAILLLKSNRVLQICEGKMSAFIETYKVFDN